MIKKLGQLTSHHICCDMDRTTNNSKESTCIVDNTVCMELDCDGVGAGEGSGDGGAAVLLVPYKALAIIDLNIMTRPWRFTLESRKRLSGLLGLALPALRHVRWPSAAATTAVCPSPRAQLLRHANLPRLQPSRSC